MRSIFVLLGILLIAGCTTPEVTPNETVPNKTVPQEPQPPPANDTMTCEEYCPTQPHIECVGTWNISGTYPDCNCEYNCDVTEVEDNDTLDIEDLVQPSNKTVSQMLDEGIAKAKTDFYTEHSGTFEEHVYKWQRVEGPKMLPGDIVFDDAPSADVKFDGQTIPSIRGAGFVVFEEDDSSDALGVVIFLASTTMLDSYTGTDAFDIEYFPSTEHRNLKDCWVYSKDFSKDKDGKWITTYSIECEKVYED